MYSDLQHYHGQETPLKHSSFGIASFIISLIVGIGDFILIVFAGYFEMNTPGGMSEDSLEAMLIGLFLIAGFGLCLVGGGLGIAGLFQKNRKKIFAVLGVIFNLIIFVGVLGLIVLGMLVG
ncbi:MAG: hypothetical protein JW867_07220 [Candidatus Omnitrophica bacterium]|nr:hypothetical protein [Candidatus Omnitrophota bacterium]